MNLPSINNPNRNLQTIDPKSTLAKSQRDATDTADATQSKSSRHELLNYDGEVVIAEGGTNAGVQVGDASANVQADFEATTNTNVHIGAEVVTDWQNGEFGVAGDAGASVNGKVNGNANADVMGTKVGVTSETWAGTGVAAEGSATMKDWNFNVGLKLGYGVDAKSMFHPLSGSLFEADTKGQAIGVNASFDAKPLVDGVIASGKEAAKTIETAVNDTANEVEDAVNDAANEIEDAVNDTANEVEDAVNEAADEIEDAVNDAADEVGEAVDTVADYFGKLF